MEPEKLRLLDMIASKLPGQPKRAGLIREAIDGYIIKRLQDEALREQIETALKPKLVAISRPVKEKR